MLILYQKIMIDGVTIPYLTDVSINSTWENQTDTAEIKLPYKINFVKDGQKVDFLKTGQKVEIWLGYVDSESGKLHKECEFLGYITKIDKNFPITLYCEDKMFELKQVVLANKIYKNIKLEELVKANLPKNATVKVRVSLDTIFDQYEVRDSTLSQLLSDLRSKYSIESYIRNWYKNDALVRSELRVSGIHYFGEDLNDVKFGKQRSREWKIDHQRNVISNDLQLSDTATKRIKAFAKIGKKRVEIVLPKKQALGAVVVQRFEGVSDEAQLEKLAKERLTEINSPKITGSFETVGIPSIRHGDRVELLNDYFGEKNGVFMVKGVKKTFGQNGYRQTVILDIRIK